MSNNPNTSDYANRNWSGTLNRFYTLNTKQKLKHKNTVLFTSINYNLVIKINRSGTLKHRHGT